MWKGVDEKRVVDTYKPWLLMTPQVLASTTACLLVEEFG
jgi:hypothetical protein